MNPPLKAFLSYWYRFEHIWPPGWISALNAVSFYLFIIIFLMSTLSPCVIATVQVERSLCKIWKRTWRAADKARSHSHPGAPQATSHSLSSGKPHLYVCASAGCYNGFDAPQCWWRITQFPAEWLWPYSTDLCTWKIRIFKMSVCVCPCVCVPALFACMLSKGSQSSSFCSSCFNG